MAYRPRDIYRGRRKFRVPLTVFLFVLSVLIISAVVLFYGLQQYLVYDQSGVSLQLPFMGGETAAPVSDQTSEEPEATFEPVPVQVVYEDPDFSDLDLGGWQELSATRARFVPFSEAINTAELESAVTNLSPEEYTGLVLELKDESGQLAWASASELAVNYGTSGALDYTETVAALHEKGLTAAAQISCCADALMARRNWPVSLQSVAGKAYQDEDGVYWLDPYNRDVRGYLIDLMAELSAMGFDEIILTNLYHPIREGGFTYSVTLQTQANPVNAVCQMARRLAESLSGTGTAVSALIDGASLRDGLSAQTGQDLEIFWRIFARLYCVTDGYDIATTVEAATERMTQGDMAVRLALMGTSAPEGEHSYVIMPQEG